MFIALVRGFSRFDKNSYLIHILCILAFAAFLLTGCSGDITMPS